MGKFWLISTELRHLIDVRNCFSLSIFGMPLPIFFKLGMRVNIVKECLVFNLGLQQRGPTRPIQPKIGPFIKRRGPHINR